MATFTSFVETLTTDGKQFEHFVKWFLKNDPEWSTQVVEVWLWDEWPGRLGSDCGIDQGCAGRLAVIRLLGE